MIKVENIYKWYGSKLAVKDVSFSVQRGESLAFIGPNGAGKSTTMRIVTGFIPASRGKVFIKGFDMDEAPADAKSAIGYLPENAPLYTGMTVFSFLLFAAEIRGGSGREAKRKVEGLLESCFLEQVRDQRIETLSKGYKHRTCFAQSIIHDPDILILDEPTDGLDPNQKREVRKLIKEMGRSKAIILSTHILDEVEAVCNRTLVIAKGKKVFDGATDDLKKLSSGYGSVLIEVIGENKDVLSNEMLNISGVSDVSLFKETQDGVELRLSHDSELSETSLRKEIFELCREKDWLVRELKIDRGDLNDVFHLITEDAEE
jgi:ABC-2 type transport system ATP-binding protein